MSHKCKCGRTEDLPRWNDDCNAKYTCLVQCERGYTRPGFYITVSLDNKEQTKLTGPFTARGSDTNIGVHFKDKMVRTCIMSTAKR